MKLTLSFLAFAMLGAFVPAAQAAIITAMFSGTVYQTKGATGEAIGNTVSGHFDLNSTTGTFLDFIIDGKSVASGYSSSAVIVPAGTDAIYTAQVNPVAVGGTSNSSYSLDLSSLTSWPTTDNAFTLLLDKTQLATNLDIVTNPLSAFPSTFSYYTANSNGTNIVSLGVNLATITVTATPEPGVVSLLGCSLVGVAFLVRRRRAQ